MDKFLILLTLVNFIACSGPEVRNSPVIMDWKEESSKIAKEYARALGPLYPESIADMGLEQFEAMAAPFSADYESAQLALALKWKTQLERRLSEETHQELGLDLKILLEDINLQIESIELSRKMGIVPFIGITEYIFGNIKDLLEADSSPKSKNNAMARFRTYVRGSEQQLPLFKGVMEHMRARFNQLEQRRARGFWPLKKEIETYLAESDDYLAAIKGILKKIPDRRWERDLDELSRQDLQFRQFLRKDVLPYCRNDNVTPYPIYSLMLKERGIDEKPKLLIERGKQEYQRIYKNFQKLASSIAKEHALPKSDPLFVMNYLKEKRINDDQEHLKLYRKTAIDLLTIIKSKRLITLKGDPQFVIRMASLAEAQSLPAPHFISSPMLGNSKRPAQFVITPSTNGRDDFSFPEAVITLTAHEAIPGHALQYHMMKERGTTLIRSRFAHNSVNVEGWALYAEDMVFPYLTNEAKFVTLQRRLWRVARMFLDPELNLGKIRPERVLDVFHKELGFSMGLAESELKRYSYIMPAQAPSYFFGYTKLMALKAELKKKPDTMMDDRCFNDAVLNLGILPLYEIRSRLLKELNCMESK